MLQENELKLPELIHPNQNGFIKGRSIPDAVRTIDDILEFAKVTECCGILLAIDFEKAFDSLNHSFFFQGPGEPKFLRSCRQLCVILHLFSKCSGL